MSTKPLRQRPDRFDQWVPRVRELYVTLEFPELRAIMYSPDPAFDSMRVDLTCAVLQHPDAPAEFVTALSEFYAPRLRAEKERRAAQRAAMTTASSPIKGKN